MIGIFDGHNLEVGSTPLDRLAESVATDAALQAHINDNTDPHGNLLRQSVLAINDAVEIMAAGNVLKLTEYGNTSTLANFLVNNVDIRGTLDVADNIITLNKLVTGAPSSPSGIEVERGTELNVNLIWDETNDFWALSDNSSNYYRILDQRDRDALDAEDIAIRNYVNDNYVHRTGDVDEDISGVKTFTAGATFINDLNVGGNAVISGDLTVNGTTTTVNTQELNISDNIINLNNDVTGAPTEDSGINVVRGTSTDVGIIWNETSDYWQLSDGTTTFYRIADQRDVDDLNNAITTLSNDVHTNYVHKTGNVNETITGDKTFDNNIVVEGAANFHTVVNVGDPKITINSGNTAGVNSRFQVERGSDPAVSVMWDEGFNEWRLTQDGSNFYRILTTHDEGAGNGIDADTVDGYEAIDFVNGNVGSIVHTGTLHAGWYTIATNSGNRASAKFVLVDETSSMHQAVHFYAGVHFGSNKSAINILSNTAYNSGAVSFDSFRIKTGGTNDGALLQVHVTTDLSTIRLSLTENLIQAGWILKDFVPDGTDPGNVNNFSALTNVTTSIIGLAPDEHTVFNNNIYAGLGSGAHYLVWHAGNDGLGSGLDADLLRGRVLQEAAIASSVVSRDSSADITARLFRSNYAEQTTAPATTADIAFRNSTTDNYIRFMTNGAFSTWCQNAHIKTYDTIHAGGLLVHSGTNNEANKIVRTDGSGYIRAGWIDTTSGDAGTATISRVYASYDGFIRYYTLEHFAEQVLAQGSTTNAHTHSFIVVDDTRSSNYAPSHYDRQFRGEFKYSSTIGLGGSTGTYSGLLTLAPWSDNSGNNAYQLGFTIENNMFLRTAPLDNSSWGGWAKIWHSDNDGPGSGLDADTVDGANASVSATANTVSQRTAAGELYASAFRTDGTHARISTSYGYVDIGPANSSYCHFQTDRSYYYFNKQLHAVDTLRVYNTTTYLTGTAGYINGSVIWNAGNDGSGSGLDADLLDGHQASYFEPAFSKNSAFNKNFGTGTNDVARGDHTHAYMLTGARVASDWGGVATGGYKSLSLPAGCPQDKNLYSVHIIPTYNTSGALGDIYVSKENTFVRVFRTGSIQCSFDAIFTW